MKHVPARVGIDTNLLIFASRPPRTATAEQVKRAKNLVRHLQEVERATICLSIISLGEFLVPVPFEKYATVTTSLETWLDISPYNMRAAHLAAKLFPSAKASNVGPNKATRAVLSADLKIVASLIAAGCTRLYSNDAGFRRLANLEAKGLEPPERIDLFDDEP